MNTFWRHRRRVIFYQRKSSIAPVINKRRMHIRDQRGNKNPDDCHFCIALNGCEFCLVALLQAIGVLSECLKDGMASVNLWFLNPILVITIEII